MCTTSESQHVYKTLEASTHVPTCPSQQQPLISFYLRVCYNKPEKAVKRAGAMVQELRELIVLYAHIRGSIPE